MHTATAQSPGRSHSHHHAGQSAPATARHGSAAKPKLYNPRHPERTLLYQTIAEHFEIWHELASAGQFDGQGDCHSPKTFVRQAFRKYLECGIFAHGFARARCGDCAHDYFVTFSCKGRGVCPSCNTRRMVETAAHLTDHVFPRLPVRQWVLSVPKRLRYFMQRDGAVLNMVLRIFLRVIAQSLQAHSPGVAQVDKAAQQIGAVAFIHRFGSSLNEHVHFHVCVVDGVFVALAGGADAGVDTDTQAVADGQSSPSKVIFHPASGIDEIAVAQVQATLRTRILRAFVGRGLLESFEAKEMLAYRHIGTAASRWTPACASKRTTAQHWSGCCATARVRPFRWSGCARRVMNWCSAAPSSTASLPVIGAALGQTSSPSRHWS